MFRSELTGETSGPHPRPDLAVKHTGGSTGAESLHSRNMFILTEVDREMQHGFRFVRFVARAVLPAASAVVATSASERPENRNREEPLYRAKLARRRTGKWVRPRAHTIRSFRPGRLFG